MDCGVRNTGRNKPKSGTQNSESVWLIVGLGNPGRKYTYTRHNIGFRVIDRMAKDEAIFLDRLEYQALTGHGKFGAVSFIIAKPMTFMNLSGEAVDALLARKNIGIKNLIILHDDVDFSLGVLRIKTGGGAGGHNGIKSIIEKLGRPDFIRIRIGVGRSNGSDLSDYVLSPFETEEKSQAEDIVLKAVDAVRSIMDIGVSGAMSQFHDKESVS